MSHDSNMALLTEHLRHTPISLMDDIIDSINKLAWKAVDAVEAGLSAAPPENFGIKIDRNDPASAELEAKVKLEIESGAHQLETLLGSTIDKNFDKMEVYALRSVVAVPEGLEDYITLEHYKGLNFETAPDAPTLESIRAQRARVQEAQRLQRLLMAEKAKNAAIIAKLRALRGLRQKTVKVEPKTEGEGQDQDVKMVDLPYPVFKLLEEKEGIDAGGPTPLKTTTEFALSQVPALENLLAELRPMQKALEEKKGASGDAGSSWRKERAEYIETQTRRHLESRGLELGPNGEVRDGEWQGGGRKLNKGEVEDLEAVVGLMGGDNSLKDDVDEKDEDMPDA